MHAPPLVLSFADVKAQQRKYDSVDWSSDFWLTLPKHQTMIPHPDILLINGHDIKHEASVSN
ncbi:hypothetical protein M438DRAFT_342647 [Aureobasidium pullulans EXF-150]|uniref:Uncharacterized protein n=1 Tax=Aureobasidium pullulans EXF-150 TaxID=1043002 RepID=A0A074XZQ7_AURPU|nr:uncharacterized protein M438DRAFT_342647 [Aureobasidium pullulans EXF-150]KEQ87472.1 hypothetical protein M438DRAFT_342647 [Aureobasidium pullulans EXF-150]